MEGVGLPVVSVDDQRMSAVSGSDRPAGFQIFDQDLVPGIGDMNFEIVIPIAPVILTHAHVGTVYVHAFETGPGESRFFP